jgi:predicted RNA methylase
MSSTNRGDGVYIRQEDDFYETPAWCVEALFDQILPSEHALEIMSVLDPCCGRGAILDVARSRNIATYGIEIDKERANFARVGGHYVTHGDALVSEWEPCDAIVTNPPFFAAIEFIENALHERTQYRCTLALLLRLNFLGSAKRAAFHKKYPANLHVMTKRPSFGLRVGCKAKKTECQWHEMIQRDQKPRKTCPVCGSAVSAREATDSIEYAWFVWPAEGKGGKWALL